MTETVDAAQLIDDTFFAYSNERMAELSEDVRFVHYTSADAAMKIIQGEAGKRHLWLRNATEMNDFSEVQHGRYCFEKALADKAFVDRFKQAFNNIDERILPDFAGMVDAESRSLKENTYLLSLSLHSGDELSMGRLSMWRAYGGNASVCLVLNSAAFGEQDAYDMVISPIMYGGPDKFKGLIYMLDPDARTRYQGA
jgi:hypothetical protein